MQFNNQNMLPFETIWFFEQYTDTYFPLLHGTLAVVWCGHWSKLLSEPRHCTLVTVISLVG